MSTALYRRYRPESFQEVIGQGHVTEPLMAALRADRANHAYLFSGPRGCGKTTSARILARCLNCVQGPTDTPCGECPSCVELARGGAGSLDVVEIDAASHNGVDDARELRERASFAPARDRYKIFILDEAHMVTAQGFNALLKLVEEPPEHVKFVFATTEPEKVIGTIRSRTHHYPFRLVPPEQLLGYLEQLCAAEGVQVGGGVLPMVVRAGGGSVRDTLSVLDQLLAGAPPEGLDYDRALALLGYTDAALLDDAIDALAARDGASLFRVVDRVIESGHDPRRFVEDLLERLRDLVLLAVAGDHAASALRGLPEDQLERMRTQAHHLRPGQLSRAADLVNAALSEMTGATSPRLQLELLCARLLLPGADDAGSGYAARLDRLEQQLATGAPASVSAREPGGAPAGDDLARESSVAGGPPLEGGASRAVPGGPAPAAPSEPAAPLRPAAPAPAAPAARAMAPDASGSDGSAEGQRAGDAPAVRDTAAQGPGEAPALPAESAERPPAGGDIASSERPAPATPPAGGDAELIRRRWSEVVATLARLRRATWALVHQNAQVGPVRGETLQLLFPTPGLAATFRSGSHAQHVERALSETLGATLRVEGVVDDGGPGGGPRTADAPPPAPSWEAAAGGDVTSSTAGAGSSGGPASSWDAAGFTSPAGGPGEPGGPVSPADEAAGSSATPGDLASSGAHAAGGAPRPASPAVASPPEVPASADGSPPVDGRGPGRPAAGPDAEWPAVMLPPDSGSTPTSAVSAPEISAAVPPDASRDAGGLDAVSEPSRPGAERAGSARGPSHLRLVPPAEPSADSPAEPVGESPAGPAAQEEPVPFRPRVAPADDTPSADDPDAEGSGMVGVPLVQRFLGGVVIEEITRTEQ